MATQNVEYLREHGPVPVSELPQSTSPSDKIDGLSTFRVRGAPASSTGNKIGGMPADIAYLVDDHDEYEVLETWIEANPKAVETKTRRGLRRILRRHGRSWHDAVDELLPSQQKGNIGAVGDTGAECPLCGDELAASHMIPVHISNEHGPNKPTN